MSHEVKGNQKILGACTVCDEMVFEVLEKYPEGHPLHGQIRKLSHALKDRDARRVSLLLLGSPENEGLPGFHGAQHEITLCAKCQITQHNIAPLWAKCMKSYADHATPEHRERLGNPPLTKEQQAYSDKVTLWMVANIPIGVLHERKWSEVT